jgi:hypothetical protein
VQFITLSEKHNVNKTRQVKPGIGDVVSGECWSLIMQPGTFSKRINQMQISGGRWQHESGKCFVTFIYLFKNHKITCDSTNSEAKEKTHRFGIL